MKEVHVMISPSVLKLISLDRANRFIDEAQSRPRDPNAVFQFHYFHDKNDATVTIVVVLPPETSRLISVVTEPEAAILKDELLKVKNERQH